MCVGLVARAHLMRILVEAVKRGTCEHMELPFSELNKQHVDAGALESATQQQLAVLEVRVCVCVRGGVCVCMGVSGRVVGGVMAGVVCSPCT